VSISHRAQQIIAVSLGVVLVGVIGATLIREYGPSDNGASNNDSTTTVVKEDAPAQDDKDNTTAPPKQDDGTKETADTPTNNFEYTAQPGASYTALARNAVRQYAATNNINLNDSQVEIVAAKLAYNAGSPYLEIGQVVTIKKSDISAIVGDKVATTTPPKDTTTPPKDDKDKKPTVKTYSFVAKAGDAYCLFARSAISEYATSNNMKLSGSQRIAAETFIISDAGFPRLAIGQQVTFSHETIKSAVDKAMSLTPAQLANWQPYATLAGM
jgi:hypothetical protein